MIERKIVLQHAKTFIYGLIAVAVTTFWSQTEGGRSMEFHFAAANSYGLRDRIGKVPPRAENVKAISFDDYTVTHLNALEPTLEQWSTILHGIAAHNPSAILIDKFPDSEFPESEETRAFVEDIRSLRVPVYVGASLHATPIVQRPSFNTFDPGVFIWDGPAPSSPDGVPGWIPVLSSYAFGTPPSIQNAFSGTGQVSKAEFGRLPPVVKLTTGPVLPHVSLFAHGKPVHITNKGVMHDSKPLSLDQNRLMAVNFLPYASLAQGLWNFRFCLRRSEQFEWIPGLNEGDIVLIITGMYTGYGDWNLSPYGITSAGIITLNLIHNLLTDSGLRLLTYDWALIATAGLLGLLFAGFLQSYWYWLSLSLAIVFMFVVGLAMQIYFYTITPWFYSILSFTMASLVHFVQKLLAADRDQWRLKHELMTARTVQSQLFPATEVIDSEVAIAAHYEPAAECGGDFWDQFQLADGRQFVIIGDAVGHGASAALIAAAGNAACLSLSRLFDSGALTSLTPGFVLQHLNRILFRSFKGEVTMTCFVAEIDRSTMKMRYANAGHVFPLHIGIDAPGSHGSGEPPSSEEGKSGAGASSGRKVKLLSSKGDPLGVTPEASYSDKSVAIAHGERLFFYTDGITEAWGPGRVQYGSKRLHQFATAHRDLGAKEFIELLMANVRLFQSGVPQEDDMTSLHVTVT